MNLKLKKQTPLNFLSTALAGLLLIVGGGASAAEPPASPGKGISVFYVGNSHNGCFMPLPRLAKLVGHVPYETKQAMILGSSLEYNWTHEEHGASFKKTFTPDKPWDGIVLLCWSEKDEEYAPKFAGEALKANPKCQVYIYTIWPDSNMDNEKPPLIRTEAHSEAVAAAVAKAFPDAPKPRVIPSSLLMRELGRMADRGELPHYDNRSSTYQDGGHLGNLGFYAISNMVMSMLFQESPLSYPDSLASPDDPQGVKFNPSTAAVPPDTGKVVKRVVWDILQTYPPAGMKPELVIADRHLTDAVAGQPYKIILSALNAQGNCAWSLTKGTLPKGIALSGNGTLEGKTTAVGEYPITIKVADGKGSVERTLTLTVFPDVAPAIPDQALPSIPLDQYLTHPIKVTGGVGHIDWTVNDDKKLPYGIMLTPGGALVGTPGEEGEFTFTVKATDSNPAGPRSTEKTFAWKIGPARPDTLMVKYSRQPMDKRLPGWYTPVPEDQTLNIDGKLDEPYWKTLPFQPIAKAVQGSPTAHAEFAAVWLASLKGLWGGFSRWDYRLPAIPGGNGDKYGLNGTGLVLAFKVHDGPKGKSPGDGIHIYLDSKHDGKVIYGAHNMHFFIPRSAKPGWQGGMKVIRGLKPPWFINVAVAEVEGGYTVEAHVMPANFVGDGQWLPMLPRSVYGLDVSVDEGEEGKVAQQVWHGDANDADDTSHFGTIILTSQPAIGTEPTLMPAK